MAKEPKVSVLFVCMGNICRSPTAEGVFRSLVREVGLDELIEIDSAGTHAYHVGEPADRRARAAAAQRGYELDGIRARRVKDEDFERFDRILAMDEDNLQILESIAQPDSRAKLGLFLEHAGAADTREVPDPYYGGPAGFDRVLDLVEEGAAGLLAELRRELGK